MEASHDAGEGSDNALHRQGIDFYTSVTRARFEELNADLFRKTVRWPRGPWGSGPKGRWLLLCAVCTQRAELAPAVCPAVTPTLRPWRSMGYAHMGWEGSGRAATGIRLRSFIPAPNDGTHLVTRRLLCA